MIDETKLRAVFEALRFHFSPDGAIAVAINAFLADTGEGEDDPPYLGGGAYKADDMPSPQPLPSGEMLRYDIDADGEMEYKADGAWVPYERAAALIGEWRELARQRDRDAIDWMSKYAAIVNPPLPSGEIPKRYSIAFTASGRAGDMYPDTEGTWMRYADHLAAFSERERAADEWKKQFLQELEDARKLIKERDDAKRIAGVMATDSARNADRFLESESQLAALRQQLDDARRENDMLRREAL